MRKALFFSLVLSLLACSSPTAQQGSDVAARIGDRTITVKDLDDRWKADNPSDHAEATQKLYEGRRAALENILATMLIEQAAKGSGMSREAFEESQISTRVKPVTDADVVSFYQGNIGQMQGRPLDAMAPAINRFLEEQRRTAARQAWLAELRSKGPDVRVMIDAPRNELKVAATDPALGPASAPVTIVEFSDFQCPFCRQVAPTLKQLREKYGDKIRVVWKDFPLTQIHPQAFKAGEAGHCAAEQGKFWEYHDRLFSNQGALQPEDLKKYAVDMGLDSAKFNACLDSARFGDRVREGVAQGSRLGVNSTPTMYVNGRLVAGAQPYEVIAAVIDEELSRAR